MGLATVFRLARAGLVLARHDAILPREYQAILPLPARLLGRLARLFSQKGEGGPGERLARALEQLGPSYVKFGQFLASRGDILTPEIAAGLAGLRDKMPPFSIAEARAALAEAFGEDSTALFAGLAPPVAAASVAQVHPLVLQDGTKLAVKILRPGIEVQISNDIEAMALGARLAERFFPSSRRLEPVEFVRTLSRSLSLEMDLRMEAAGASELAEVLHEQDQVAIPEVDWSRTRLRVFTMHWMDGVPLSDEAALDATKIDRVALGKTVTGSFLQSALDHGVFHADMHEGNLFALGKRRLGLVDFGILGRIGPAERRYLAEILYGFLRRDYRRVAEVHFEAGYVPGRYGVDDFAQALRAVGEPIFGKTAKNVSMSHLLLQLFDVTAQFDMHLRPELVLLQKTMVQVEGVARMLDPDHDLWGTAAPVVENWIRRELGVEGKVNDAYDTLRELHRVLVDLPAAIESGTQIITDARKNGLKLSEESLAHMANAQAHRNRWTRRALVVLALATVGIAVKMWI
ncbi:MAG: 2-polyprenylphenol 6-hydroxylase [Robiginitomaculum sp.]|nr:MAG: 2-polyprenylphenol 6-hydroxylase [Robiginitomaculum sp.]